ncbi:FAD binding domain-containing protein, partial [Streptomyces erythrochromogenes]|uniref:FAD binding domain-containing protein n=1 Tax=Streptomyces erythrochromogenes TaxID=285574 RepID=UPI0036BEB166
MMISTVEGCGSVKSGCISNVQNGLATNNGTQCGYCTPGWIMNMTAAVAQKGPKPGTKAEIEALFDGNLCRCTGYRPILYGFKKEFASDWDVAVDERGCMVCDVDPAEKVNSVAPVDIVFPDELKRAPRAVRFERDGYVWCRPSTLAGVTGLLREYTDRSDVRLVGGNTSTGVYPRSVENPHVFIDIAHLPELCDLRMDGGALHIGGAVSYADLLEFLDVLIPEMKSTGDPATVGLAALQYMARRTAGTIVRNAATLAGNTMMVVRHCVQGVPFPSDCYTAMGTLGATLTISTPQHREPQKIDLLELPEHWQRSRDMQDGCVVLRYELRMTGKDEFAQTYKTALREVNAHSIVNGGFRVRLDADHCVADAIVVLGGIAPSAMRMRQTETTMRGRRWDSSLLATALTELGREVGGLMERYASRFAKLPDEGFSPEYKLQLAQSFLYKFFIEVCEWRGLHVPRDVQSGGRRALRPVSKGTQAYVDYPDEYPVNIPYVKIESFLQSTGEAQYTQDIALPQTGFNGAPVQSTVAKGTAIYSVPDVSGPATPQEVLVALKKRYP